MDDSLELEYVIIFRFAFRTYPRCHEISNHTNVYLKVTHQVRFFPSNPLGFQMLKTNEPNIFYQMVANLMLINPMVESEK